jgi:hypothetical protein
MPTVLPALVALAVVDSINPSAIAVTLYLLTRSRVVQKAGVYIAAVFLTYLALGGAMMLGLDALVSSLSTAADGRLGYTVQGAVGLALLLYAILAPAHGASTERPDPGGTTLVAVALLGVTVTAMELPTAVPYFATTALLTSAGLPIEQWLPLLVLYNAIFILPPVLLLAGHLVFGRRLDAQYDGLRTRLQAGARGALLWICGLVGGALLVTSAIEYIARF